MTLSIARIFCLLLAVSSYVHADSDTIADDVSPYRSCALKFSLKIADPAQPGQTLRVADLDAFVTAAKNYGWTVDTVRTETPSAVPGFGAFGLSYREYTFDVSIDAGADYRKAKSASAPQRYIVSPRLESLLVWYGIPVETDSRSF